MDIKHIQDSINELDTHKYLRIVKAFYLKGLLSIVSDFRLIDALADINLDLIALEILLDTHNLSLATLAAKQKGKDYGNSLVK